MSNERPIPEAALRDQDAVELLRVWIAEKKLHCSIKVGMYQDSTRFPEEMAWGTILADLARHVANALQEGYSKDPDVTLSKISEAFLKELQSPTSRATGVFVSKH